MAFLERFHLTSMQFPFNFGIMHHWWVCVECVIVIDTSNTRTNVCCSSQISLVLLVHNIYLNEAYSSQSSKHVQFCTLIPVSNVSCLCLPWNLQPILQVLSPDIWLMTRPQPPSYHLIAKWGAHRHNSPSIKLLKKYKASEVRVLFVNTFSSRGIWLC